MKYVHYAPQAPLHLVLAPSVLKDRVAAAAAQGRRVGILASRELLAELPAVADAVVIECGSRDDMMSVAAVLYGALRTFDSQGVDVIFAETFSHDELGAAVMNRLLKAAGGKVIKN
jgi:L-threonylcarbamoyladenylate synthase